MDEKESLADMAIKNLQDTANRLISEQNQSKVTILKPESIAKRANSKKFTV